MAALDLRPEPMDVGDLRILRGQLMLQNKRTGERFGTRHVQMRLLERLAGAGGAPVSEGELRGHLYGRPAMRGETSRLRTTIVRLRQKLRDHGIRDVQIATVVGQGYALVERPGASLDPNRGPAVSR